jgi:Probable cobalt transporter subunit (CbtB)
MATHTQGISVRPLSISVPAGLWLAGTLILALLVYYFVGIDQGATSVFGSDMHIHEFVHDGRHFLGFPCH